jgi:septal ring factor EnvC (AmiA/AmiB activator)
MTTDRDASVAPCVVRIVLLGMAVLFALGCEPVQDQGGIKAAGAIPAASSDDARLHKIREQQQELRRLAVQIDEIKHKMIRAKRQAEQHQKDGAPQMADMSHESQRLKELEAQQEKIGHEIDSAQAASSAADTQQER